MVRRRRGAGGIRTLTALAVFVASAVVVGCGAAVFECDGEQDCVGGGAEGVCQSDGWCSFADGACSSGQRYGERAPAGIANACVDQDLDASTGIAGTDTDPSTTAGSMTSTSATTSDATTTSTTDATSMTTDPTTSMTTLETMTSSPTSDGETDSAGTPMCGDGVIDPESEQCDGSEFGGLDCGSFDFDGGMLVCDQCSITTAGCSDCVFGCPTMCSGADECSEIESCVVPVMDMGGSCWPQCMDDSECSMFFMGTACFLLEAGPACLFPCGMNDQCPDGLTCSQLENMQLACL